MVTDVSATVPRRRSHVALGARWTLWTEFGLRSAGFPADGVRRLADESLGAAADRLLRSGDDADSSSAFARAWEQAIDRLGRDVVDIARSRRFRAAVAWQNPGALETALAPLVADPEAARNFKRRRREQLVARYWQRYCVKNESIGFFGPGASGTLRTELPRIRVRPGRRLVDACETYVEAWAGDAIASSLDRDRRLAAWLAPRRPPFLSVHAKTVLLAGRPPIAVDELTAMLLARCDGTTPALEVAAAAAQDDGTVTADAAYEALERLHRRRWLIWNVEVPGSLRPLDELRRIVARVGDDDVRDAALRPLGELEAVRQDVDRAARDPEALRVALARADGVFARLAGARPSRNEGQTYGGRTILYRDCRRAVDVALGRDFLEAAAPLELVLESARWITWNVRRELEAPVRAAYARLRDRLGRSVDAGSLWLECLPLFAGEAREVVADVVAECRRRWAGLLDLPGTGTRAAYEAAGLGDGVRGAFAAAASGWSEARYASPDLMIAARDPQAVACGDFELVLAELHVGMNALDYRYFADLHREPDRLGRCLVTDFPQARLLMALPRESGSRVTVRTHRALVRPFDVHVVTSHRVPPPREGTVRAAAEVAVVERDRSLLLEPGGDRTFDVFDLFAEPLKRLLLEQVDLFDAEHVPRISFDRLVVARERWRVDAADLDFACAGREADRFLETRRWWHDVGLPRRVFVRSPLEAKPIYVDVESPHYVEIFAAAVRRAREANPGGRPLRLVEMLPTPEQAWLTDASGRCYTSEIRLVAFDSGASG